jgi:hypothetical protein
MMKICAKYSLYAIGVTIAFSIVVTSSVDFASPPSALAQKKQVTLTAVL